MNKPSPPSIVEYFERHGQEIGVSYTEIEQSRRYEFVMQSVRMSIQSGEFVRELVDELTRITEQYANGHPNLLYYPSDPSDIIILSKSYTGVVSKIYRVNCLNNNKYPSAPRSGFITHETLYESINDLLRTRLVCKYMDGPEYVCRKLSSFAKEKGISFHHYPMASELGYYAWHCYFRVPAEVMIGGNVHEKQISLEIQFTTQLAEVITSLTHGLYEHSRERKTPKSDNRWRWQPRSQQFRSAYLGHTLHLLEGIIQTFRDEVLEIDAEDTDEAEGREASAVVSDSTINDDAAPKPELPSLLVKAGPDHVRQPFEISSEDASTPPKSDTEHNRADGSNSEDSTQPERRDGQ